MKIIICRHGETDFNVQRRLQGQLETSINERGRKQAKLLAEKLKEEKFDQIFCSPQKRCKETIAEVMKFHTQNKVNYRDELREVSLGKYTSMNRQEIEKKFPGDWADRVDNKYEFIHEGGESYKEADEKRVKPLLKEFSEKYSSRKILVLTHGGICRLLLGDLLGLDPKGKMEIELPNECIYYVDYLPHKTTVHFYLTEHKMQGEGYLTKEMHEQKIGKARADSPI